MLLRLGSMMEDVTPTYTLSHVLKPSPSTEEEDNGQVGIFPHEQWPTSGLGNGSIHARTQD